MWEHTGIIELQSWVSCQDGREETDSAFMALPVRHRDCLLDVIVCEVESVNKKGVGKIKRDE